MHGLPKLGRDIELHELLTVGRDTDLLTMGRDKELRHRVANSAKRHRVS